MENIHTQLRLTCRSCGKQTPLKELNYGQNKKDFYCIDCHAQKSKPLPKVEQLGVRKVKDKLPYTCKKCSYKFNIKLGAPYIKRCPYCGREDYLQKDDEFTTERLLREITDNENQ